MLRVSYRNVIYWLIVYELFIFFFQAEDGIRDDLVTGVQTCALPIFSTMVIPPGHEGPLHTHHDVEEVFFVLQGQMTCFMEKDGERVERTLGPRDAISVPAGVARGERNDGTEDALMLVIVGAGKPQLPTYPENSPMYGVTRD